jgi:hypothetical protein
MKDQEIEDEAAAVRDTVEAGVKAKTKLERMTIEYQTKSAGLSATTDSRTLPEQISQAYSDSETAESKVALAKLKLIHLSLQQE